MYTLFYFYREKEYDFINSVLRIIKLNEVFGIFYLYFNESTKKV